MDGNAFDETSQSPPTQEATTSDGDTSISSVTTLNDLPVEVWLEIARFVPPEGLLAFSLLCRKTNEALRLSCFWLRLYKRYRPPPLCSRGMLPVDLTLNSIKRGKGLRTKVIRALYRMYPLFNKRPIMPVENLEFLVGQKCCGLWIRKQPSTVCGKKRTFYLKLEDLARRDVRQLCHPVNANYEANMKILMIDGFENQQFPSLKGLVLQQVLRRSITVTKQMGMVRVPSVEDEITLRFCGEEIDKVVVVVKSDRLHKFVVSVLDWWDVYYPYPYLMYAKERAVKRRISMGKFPHKNADAQRLEDGFAAFPFGNSDENDDNW